MNSSELLILSQQIRQSALEVLKELDIVNRCRSIGIEVNIIGSLKSDLMLNHRDIDLHLYSDEPIIEKSFSLIKQIATNNGVKDIHYKNLLDTKEECIEWHLLFDNEDGEVWKLDMIHIKKGSCYDGYFENVTKKIIQRLTPETKNIILEIKYKLGTKSNVPGIQIYQAVLDCGIKNYTDFIKWQNNNSSKEIVEWIP
jgi:hypothetical protein